MTSQPGCQSPHSSHLLKTSWPGLCPCPLRDEPAPCNPLQLAHLLTSHCAGPKLNVLQHWPGRQVRLTANHLTALVTSLPPLITFSMLSCLHLILPAQSTVSAWAWTPSQPDRQPPHSSHLLKTSCPGLAPCNLGTSLPPETPSIVLSCLHPIMQAYPSTTSASSLMPSQPRCQPPLSSHVCKISCPGLCRCTLVTSLPPLSLFILSHRAGLFFNYFSIGLDAKSAFSFHRLREGKPWLTVGRLSNQFWYSWFSCASGRALHQLS